MTNEPETTQEEPRICGVSQECWDKLTDDMHWDRRNAGCEEVDPCEQ